MTSTHPWRPRPRRLEPVMGGQFGRMRLAYLDTFDALGVYIELIEDPTGMLWATKPWRDHKEGP